MTYRHSCDKSRDHLPHWTVAGRPKKAHRESSRRREPGSGGGDEGPVTGVQRKIANLY